MFTPISIDSSFLSLSADLLPDTSGLTPLTLPADLLSDHTPPRQQPSPEAIRRFQSALASDTPSPRQILSSLLPSTPSTPPAPTPPPPTDSTSSPLPASEPPRDLSSFQAPPSSSPRLPLSASLREFSSPS
ncbi:MAG: hypothetical protein IKQ15_10215, partial [Kiritimatiellae bacterium]|nr:hypothetical protein [Kiritimatiellia bacterium]